MSKGTNLSRVITIVILLIASIGILFAVVNFNKSDVVVLEPGKAAPDFTLQTVDGKTVKLSDLKGKVVVVNFWATWCEPCRQEMPAVEKAYEHYKNQGLVVLGVNLKENNVSVKGFADTFKLTFPILMDKDGTVAVDTYKVKPIPTTFFIDRQGVLQQKVESPMTDQFLQSNLEPLLADGR